MKNPFRDCPEPVAVIYDTEAEYQRLLAATPPLPPIEPLPPLSTKTRCLKCGSRAVTITYFESGYGDCPDARLDYSPRLYFWPFSIEARVRAVRHGERYVEHHDRRCVNCGFAWVEAVKCTS